MFLIYELTPLSKNYANAAEDAQQFFVTLSIQADDLNAKNEIIRRPNGKNY